MIEFIIGLVSGILVGVTLTTITFIYRGKELALLVQIIKMKRGLA